MAGKGIFGRILDEISEPDPGEKKAAPEASATPAAPIAPPPATIMPPAAAPVFQAATAATGAAGVPDEETLNVIRQSVFAPQVNGRASLYLEFSATWDALSRPAYADPVFKVMKVHNPTLSAQDILNDVQAHATLLDQTVQRAGADFDTARSQRLGSIDAHVKELTDANENAAAEIARHQSETAKRQVEITQALQDRVGEDAKINAAQLRTEAAEQVVRLELQGIQQLVSAIH